MYVCILDRDGQVLAHKNLPSNPEAFLEVIAPYRDDLVVAVECIFTWYWLADLCAAEGIAFVLGHALYMKAIHGGKAKNDRIDALKIAMLLRSGMLPQAYVYPAGMRAPIRAIAKASPITSRTAWCARPSPSISPCSIATTRSWWDLESYLVRQAKQHDAQAFQLLRSIPGVGKVLALTILYEIHDVKRFDRVREFASYARLVKCAKESAGMKHGTSGAKMGNVHLKWAFSEAAVLFVRHSEPGKELLARLEKRHGKGKALSILAHKLGRAAYYILLRGKAFEIERFVATEREKAPVMSPKIRQLHALIGRALSLPLSTSRLDCLRLCPSPEPCDNGPSRSTP
jgi:transposase